MRNLRTELARRLLFSIQLKNRIRKKTGIAVLMYHSVTTDNKSEYRYCTNGRDFKIQMDLVRSLFEPIPLSDAIDLMGKGEVIQTNGSKPKCVVTFDDGYKNNLTVAYPILREFRIPLTIFLTTGFVDSGNETFMSWADAQSAVNDELVTFGAHTTLHANLKSLVEVDKANEILESRQIIEQHTGRSVDYFAYPGGGYDESCLELVRNEYRAAFIDRTPNRTLVDFARVPRISIDSRHDDLHSFLLELWATPFIQFNATH